MASLNHAKIRWAPKVRPETIGRLYEGEAAGLLRESLVDEIGLALLLRVESVLHYMRNQVRCPACGTVFSVAQEPVRCPGGGCAWATTRAAYRASRRHRDLNVANARAAFEAFEALYPRARPAPERMLLIDRLIHDFHWDAKVGEPNRSVGNNLIEGSHADVVAFLDALSANGREADKSNWRQVAAKMRRRRSGRAS